LVQTGPDLVVLFGDSAELSLLPTITRCWSKVGRQRVIRTPGVHAQKRWDWGAVEPTTGRTVHVVHPRRNNVGFRRLLAAIARAFGLGEHPARRVVLFVDNDRVHDALPVRELLAHHEGRIVIERLPPYSPELNPQECIWRHLRRRVTHNHYFEELDALLEATGQFHQELRDAPGDVARLLRKWTGLIAA
jgi:transposase